jgi:hypothetical protein
LRERRWRSYGIAAGHSRSRRWPWFFGHVWWFSGVMTLLDGQIGARGDASPRRCMKAGACWCLQRTPGQPERRRRMVGSIQSAKNTGDCIWNTPFQHFTYLYYSPIYWV